MTEGKDPWTRTLRYGTTPLSVEISWSLQSGFAWRVLCTHDKVSSPSYLEETLPVLRGEALTLLEAQRAADKAAARTWKVYQRAVERWTKWVTRDAQRDIATVQHDLSRYTRHAERVKKMRPPAR